MKTLPAFLGIIAVAVILAGCVSSQPAANGSLTSQAPPETTLPPAPKTYTLSDIAAHSSQADCWTSVNGKVYDITNDIKAHPGGVENILKACGKDSTQLFKSVPKHEGPKATSSLERGLIGTLQS